MRLNERNWLKKSAKHCLKRRLSYLSERNRPRSITLLAIIEIVLGVLLLLSAFGRGFDIMRHMRWSVESAGMFLVIFAAISFCLAFGLWTGKAWAWVGGIALAVFGIIFSVFTLFIRPTIGEGVYLIVNTVMIYFLIEPRVQRHFGSGSV